jgi:hypothetical protein
VSKDAEFLLNRFPVASGHVTKPLDGDRARPIEIFTQGYHSRRRCNSELTYYVSSGTPCLVHVKRVKGSALAPKVRWGIAAGRTGDTTHFECPFTKVPFCIKSYVAYKLREGLCYTDFLGLPQVTTTKKMLTIPDDGDKEDVVLELPKQNGPTTDKNALNGRIQEDDTVPLHRYIVPEGQGETDRDYVETPDGVATDVTIASGLEQNNDNKRPSGPNELEPKSSAHLIRPPGDALADTIEILACIPTGDSSTPGDIPRNGEGNDSRSANVTSRETVRPPQRTRVGSLEINNDQGIPMWVTPGGEIEYHKPSKGNTGTAAVTGVR